MTEDLPKLNSVLRDYLSLPQLAHLGRHPIAITQLDVIDPRSLGSLLGPEVLSGSKSIRRKIILNQVERLNLFNDIPELALGLGMRVHFPACLQPKSLLLHFSEIEQPVLDKGVVWLEALVEFLLVLVPSLVVEALVLAGRLLKVLVFSLHFVRHRH